MSGGSSNVTAGDWWSRRGFDLGGDPLSHLLA
jgi:hypothetical protein